MPVRPGRRPVALKHLGQPLEIELGISPVLIVHEPAHALDDEPVQMRRKD